LPLVLLTPAANLLPVSLTPLPNLPLVLTTLAVSVENLPPVVHLYLRISLIFETKIEMTLLFSGAWVKIIHEKTKAKSLRHD
jgi:hypothetical protein